MSRPFAKLALLGATTILLLLAMEVGLRVLRPSGNKDVVSDSDWDSLLHIQSPVRQQIYEMRPNAEVPFPEFNTTYKTNSSGFRDREYSASKAEGVYRIVVIGDSVSFGWGVELDKSYPKVLEELFVNAGQKVEVLSMAVSGYNTIQEAALLRESGLAVDPDLVIIGYCLNDKDFGVDGGLRAYFTDTPSRLVNTTRRVGMRIRNKYFGSIPERGFSTIRELCSEKGIPVVVAIFPTFPDGGEEEDAPYGQSHEHEVVTGWAEDAGFEVIDLLSKFEEHGRGKNSLDIYHPNNDGHRLAAEELFRYLNSR